MIIASNGHIRMKGNGVDVLSEFVTIAAALMIHDEITPEILKHAIDIAYLEKENQNNDHRTD